MFAMVGFSRVARTLSIAALLGWNTTAQAASLQVSPIQLGFAPTQQAQALHLSNTGAQPLEAQVRVQRWSQVGGKEQLDATQDMVASPAIVRIAPGQRQVVRLVRPHPKGDARELSYRVLVDELPGSEVNGRGGLKLLLRYSIPVFVAPDAAPKHDAGKTQPVQTDLSRLHGELVQGAQGKAELQLRNDGATHVRVSYLSLVGPDGARQWLGNGLIGYVLPGQQMRWPLDVTYPLAVGHTLKARFNDDREARPVPLDTAGR